MQPLNTPRRRAWRAMLSALAGGGLTAASLSGQLSSTAFGAGVSTAPSDGSTPPVTSTAGATTPAATPSPSTTSTPAGAPAPAPASTTQPSTAPPPAPEAPKVVLKRKQKSTASPKPKPSLTATSPTSKSAQEKAAAKATGPNNVALSPQLIASRAGALAAELASSAASVQALAFYRIPPFLLPIYKAAAAQYGVPWQILAAINEIETNYGSDQSVSSAGAVGWMQFMPATWLQYGVDALNAGNADPYNPVDAIFAAARYLRAAGSATDLHGAILAYNHSEEYVSSVLLRAKLISTYPRSVVATLTGLIDAHLPVTGKQLAWGVLLASRGSATANASAVAPKPTSAAKAATATAAPAVSSAAPGASAAPAPATAAAAAAGKGARNTPPPLQLVDLMSAPTATVVAVQDGRIEQIGESRELGKYVILRDVYGDVFTYAGLGSIAPTYTPHQASPAARETPAATIAKTHDRAPSQAASAGRQPPLTLQVKTPKPPPAPTGAAHAVVPGDSAESAPAGMGRVRLFAHPGNPDALAAAATAASRARSSGAARPQKLRRGSVVATGTVLGRVRLPAGAVDGHMRFAIRPSGDAGTIDPRPVLASWAQLAAAVHPQGAKATGPLLGATASDVFLLAKADLQSAVLADPGIVLDACARADVASGALDSRALAVLAFLSRSGLKPTVSGVRCAQPSGSGAAPKADSVTTLEVSAINGTPIAGHQGPGSVTDLAIRTLLSLPHGFMPERIVSLMRYPGASNTHATPQSSSHIQIVFHPAAPTVTLSSTAPATVAHSAGHAATAPAAPLVVGGDLSPAQWDQLIKRIAALPAPTVPAKQSPAAIPDPKHP
jgi:soluble lytic murein transglycosylase-like protein